MPKKVILDSNFLFLPLQHRIGVFEEVERVLSTGVEFILPTPVYREVERIALNARKPSLKKQASFAVKLTERCARMNSEKMRGETVDDYLVRLAKETGYIVATADGELRSRLRKMGLPVIYPRRGKHLVVEGYTG